MRTRSSPASVPVLCSVVLVGLVGAGALPTTSQAQESATTPSVPTDGWMRYAAPEEAGWSSGRIADVKAFADSVGSSVGMLVHDGVVVTSWGDVTYPASVFSLAKSLQVLTVGKYVEQGDVDLDATLGEVGIDVEPPLEPCEEEARVRHLLAMKSGVYRRSTFSSGGELPDPCSATPGEQFHYHNWDVDALNAVFEKETGVAFQEAFWTDVARPLGFEDTGRASVRYVVSPAESSLRHVSAHLSARDMARIGLLMLRDGRWDGEQVVPTDWLERMRSPQHRFEQGHAVGWLVWLPWYEERHRELGTYVISGSGLNAVVVVPDEDLVFVHRAHPLNGGVHGQLVHEELFRLMDARTGQGEPDPELVPFDPGG